jgi:DNA-binding NtrC family response regulator
MHPQLQAKLLRAIQEREITRIGNNDPVKIDVRLIATSNRNLEDSVKKGEFREDLYFRLNVVNLRLPSLRERPNDIVLLAQFFADKFSEQNGMTKKAISKESQAAMKAAAWRGNIRELENTMHRAILMSVEEEIEPAALILPSLPEASARGPARNETPGEGTASSVKNPGAVETLIGRTIADVERDMILNTLDHCLGNRTHAANILGISIRTLRNKLNEYKDSGIDIPAA